MRFNQSDEVHRYPASGHRPIHDEIASIVTTAEVWHRFEALGLDVVANTRSQFVEQIGLELVKWGNVVRTAHLRSSRIGANPLTAAAGHGHLTELSPVHEK
jgi:hypothetical protein